MPAIGDLVIVAASPERGAWRVERVLEDAGETTLRLLSYRDGSFEIVPLDAVAPCPAGLEAAGSIPLIR